MFRFERLPWHCLAIPLRRNLNAPIIVMGVLHTENLAIVTAMRIELLLFLSFLALVIVMVACSVPRKPRATLSPGLFPEPALTAYDPRLVSRVSMAVGISVSIAKADAKLPQVEISPPQCYRTLAPRLSCFGYLYNRAKSAISDVRLWLRYSENESPASARSFVLEQTRILPGEKAPYRLQLAEPALPGATIELGLEQAALSSAAKASAVDLRYEDAGSVYREAEHIYRFSGRLQNQGETALNAIRLIITLENEARAIVAYRALDLRSPLPAGESQAVELSLALLDAASEVHQHVTALALEGA